MGGCALFRDEGYDDPARGQGTQVLLLNLKTRESETTSGPQGWRPMESTGQGTNPGPFSHRETQQLSAPGDQDRDLA